MKKLLIIFLILPVVAGAVDNDKTPYNFIIGANAHTSVDNYTVTFVAERYDGIYSYGDYPLLADSVLDTLHAWGDEKRLRFRFGPYASTQEIPLWQGGWTDSSYAARIADADPFWIVYYAYAYLDSVGISRESLVVHFDEDTINITQEGDGNRGYSLTDLPYHQKRFSYQYWGNTSSDTFMYPGGYVWLLNGYNDDAKAAVAYAFKRHFIEDSANYGSGKYMYNLYYADNQLRGGIQPRMPYYTINYTFGGASSVMDWIEQSEIENNATSLFLYYDSSTLTGDSAIDSLLNAVCDSADLSDSIIRIANIDKYSHTFFKKQIKYTSVHFELVFGATGEHWAIWRQTMLNHDTLQARNSATGADRRYAVWECRTDASVNEGSWNTGDRLYYGVYAWFLTFQEDNMYLYPARFDDTTRWRSIYEVGLGTRLDATFDTTNFTGVGDYDSRAAVIRCKYLNGTDTAISLYRTGCQEADAECTNDYTGDSVLVQLGNTYNKIDVDGDTAEIGVESVYLFPCQGWIGTMGVAAVPREGQFDGTYRGVTIR